MEDALDNIDENPFFGRVAYTFGLWTDQPLSVVRIGYGTVQDSAGYTVPHYAFEPFAIIPIWDNRGQVAIGVFEDGAARRCAVAGTLRCVRLGWPNSWFAYVRPNYRANAWHGSLLRDRQDEAGVHYRRNRYYDPQTGRFTQEDPIGLAGGLNLYGYAGGDPVNFGDPFGLKVCFKGKGKEVQRLADSTAVATGTTFDLDDENCAKNVQPASGEWDEVSLGFAELADDDLVYVPIAYGIGGSRNDPSGVIIIDPADTARRYPVKGGVLGMCRRGSDRYDEPAIIGHELGHAWATLYTSQSRRQNNRTAVRWENRVHRARGRTQRGCHW